MSITPTWRIANLEREVATGKVITVHYAVDMTDGTYSVEAYGSIGVDGELSVPFDALTEDTVVGWVKTQLGDDRISELTYSLAVQLQEKRSPKIASGLPW